MVSTLSALKAYETHNHQSPEPLTLENAWIKEQSAPKRNTLLDWDLSKNILVRGLLNYSYWNYTFPYKDSKVVACECLDSYLLAKKVQFETEFSFGFEFHPALFDSQNEVSISIIRNGTLKEGIALITTAETLSYSKLSHYNTDMTACLSKGILLFGDRWYQHLLDVNPYSNNYKNSCEVENLIKKTCSFLKNKLPEELIRVIKDFLVTIPGAPCENEHNPDKHPNTGQLIRRTICVTEFNVSTCANRLASEYFYAMLSYPIINKDRYHYKDEDLKKFYFVIEHILTLTEYYIIVLDDNHEKVKQYPELKLKQYEKDFSICPLLLSFIPGVSSIATGDTCRGDDIDYKKLFEYYGIEDETT